MSCKKPEVLQEMKKNVCLFFRNPSFILFLLCLSSLLIVFAVVCVYVFLVFLYCLLMQSIKS